MLYVVTECSLLYFQGAAVGCCNPLIKIWAAVSVYISSGSFTSYQRKRV